MNNERPIIRLYLAASIRDAAGIDARPGALAVAEGRVLAAGSPAAVRAVVDSQLSLEPDSGTGQDAVSSGRSVPGGWVGAGVETVEMPDALILPGMVNAHAHLDLTAIGPRVYDAASGDFSAWLRGVANDRPKDEPAIRAAVTRGCDDSLAAGVAYLGDIAKSEAAIDARRQTGLAGVTYLECFGPGRWQDETIAALRSLLREAARDAGGVRLGLSPHAPYTTGHDIYAYAAGLALENGLPVSTHLAESIDEERFTYALEGPFIEHLRRFGKWDESVSERTPTGLHPVDWLGEILDDAGWVLAHCNRVGDEQIARLATTDASVAYCPVASDYFGHTDTEKNPHRYRDMLDAGINVCLGTDSILCQALLGEEPQPMGILPQMRYLYRRDGTDPETLLRMATTNGMAALRLDPRDATFAPGAIARPISVPIDTDHAGDAFEQALRSDAPARRLD